MRSLVLVGLAVLVVGCHPRVGVRHGIIGGGGVRIGTNENVNEKRHEWFQGLYRDCVNHHQANACYKTGQNIEDGVVAPPNQLDAHWFYAKACDLQQYDMYCWAADRTDPELQGDDHHHSDHEAAR